MKNIIDSNLKGGVKNLKNVAGKSRGFIDEFKEFISRGNVIDLAVGVIIGGAFGKIVSSLVNDIIMPLVGVMLGGHDFTGLTATVGNANITYGVFMQNIVDFIIVAACIFIFVKVINKLNRKMKDDPEKAGDEAVDEQLQVLKDIRAELKKSSKKH
ncbi:large conductance mechanosensitive channel protein MscL [Candidatus Saccharibacteria bacterium]|jgi:large conductance mechanosensitive channel|nr:large conductance mechanosensitive channel protein MscL [Candidatus Saccharibacteria bacterium]